MGDNTLTNLIYAFSPLRVVSPAREISECQPQGLLCWGYLPWAAQGIERKKIIIIN